MRYRTLSTALAGALVLLAVGPAPAQQEFSFEGERLLVTNLAGEVTVRGHDGSRIVIRATPGGSEGGTLDFQVKRGGSAEFHVVYPLNQSRSIRYRDHSGSTQFRIRNWTDESSFLEEVYASVSGNERIRIGPRGDVEAWADLEILVPRGVATRVKLAVGQLKAMNVQAPLDLDTHAGPVRAENITGDTNIDTGSGSVAANTIRGNLNVDTGSGRVEVGDVEGDEVSIDTGSGSVTVERARARRLEVDTGSGSVRTSEIYAGESNIDTGSGSVTLDLMELDDGEHVVDTGSGGVTITLPANASARIFAETGSGGINLDVPDARLRRMSRDLVELEIGDGRARIEIDTGSGGIRIRTR